MRNDDLSFQKPNRVKKPQNIHILELESDHLTLFLTN